MESDMISTIYDPTIWHEPDDKSTLSYDVMQIFPDASTTYNVSNTSGQVKFLLRRSNAFILLSHPDTCIRFKLRYAGLQNNLPYSYADIAPQSNLGSMLLSKVQFRICNTPLTDMQNFFHIFNEIENNMEGLEFRQKSGEEQGFIPDKTTGMAESIKCAYLSLVATQNMAPGDSGTFFVLYFNDTGVDIAPLALFNMTIDGTDTTIKLVAPAAGIPKNTQTACYVAPPIALAAATVTPWSFEGVPLPLWASSAVAPATQAAISQCYIYLTNNTGSTIVGDASGNVVLTPGTTNQIEILRFPLGIGYNINYEPGYVRRKKYYNYVPNSGLNDTNFLDLNNFNDRAWRYIDIKLPLSKLSRFCAEYQAVIGNCDIGLDVTMSTYVRTVPNTNTIFNASPPANGSNVNGLNAVFGTVNSQMIIQPMQVTMDYVQYYPGPEAVISLNQKFQSKFIVDYTECECTIFPATWNISTQKDIMQMELPTRKRICYLIIVFKNRNQNLVTQNYGGFVNGNITSMQVKYGTSTLIPTFPQGDDFTNLSNVSKCSGPLHFYGQYRNLFERWHSTKETPMSLSDFRNLYTMYCFDFTDVNQGNKNIESNIGVTLNRVVNSTETVSSFECYYALYYKRTATFDFTTSNPTVQVD